MPDVTLPGIDQRFSRRTFVIVVGTVCGAFLIASAYAFATPLGSSPDEPDHWRYAYAVQTGQDTSDGGLTVPESLTGFPAACVNEHPEVSAACVPEIRSDLSAVETTTHFSGNPRLYYRIVGWPLTEWPEESGLIASRVLSALVSALFLGIAILPWTGSDAWLMRLAILLTAAPSTLFFSGTINPQGMETALFSALWSLSVAIFARLGAGGYRSLPLWIQIVWPPAMVIAVNTRPLSAWYAAVLLVTCWLWYLPPIRRTLKDGRLVLAAIVVLAAAVVRALAIVTGTSSSGFFGTGVRTPVDVPYQDRLASALWRVLNNPSEGIGMLGWLDTRVPSGATAMWFLLAGGIMFFAAPYVRRRHCLALAALLACLVGTWITLDPLLGRTQNLPFWQARYGFPLWLGVPILLAATVVAAASGSDKPLVVLLHRLGAAAGLVVLQVLALGYLLVRYRWPAGWLGPIGDAEWLPYAPSRFIAAGGIAGALLLVLPALLITQRTRAAPDAPDAEPELEDAARRG